MSTQKPPYLPSERLKASSGGLDGSDGRKAVRTKGMKSEKKRKKTYVCPFSVDEIQHELRLMSECGKSLRMEKEKRKEEKQKKKAILLARRKKKYIVRLKHALKDKPAASPSKPKSEATVNRERIKKHYHSNPIETTSSIKAWPIPMGGQNKRY